MMLIETLETRRLFTSVPIDFTQTQITDQLTSPTAMQFAPDGRLFVAEQGGAIRIIKGGQLLPQPFATLTTDDSGERGIVGLTLDPNFESNHFVYIYYTIPGASEHNRVARLTADGDVADASSLTTIFDIDPLSSATNHNGGALHFGTDGKLFIAVGENANPSLAQSMTSLKGKILRINSDGSIPADDPFFNTATGDERAIWAMGLRNPFTFAVQPFTGKVFINDVGQSTWEEIDEGVAGANYGWPIIEGKRTTETAPANYQDPLYTYIHDGTVQAITGGVFYSPVPVPSNAAAAGVVNFPAEYDGSYFFADLGAAWVKRLDPQTNQVTDFASDLPARPVDLDVGRDGSLYVLSNSGSITKIAADQTQSGGGGGGQAITLAPSADATIRNGKFAAKNFGRKKNLQVSQGARAGQTREALVSFDLSGVSTISNATLTIAAKAAGRKVSSVDLDVTSLEGAALAESTVSFSNPPAATQETSVGTVTVARAGRAQNVELDLTSYLQAFKAAGATSVTLQLAVSTENTGGLVTFASREARHGGPQLVITP